MEEKKQQLEKIDLSLIAKNIWVSKHYFYKTLPITFIVAVIFIFSIPRYYETQVKLAPEMEGNLNSGTLSSIASSFGFNMNNLQTTDAITPLLYPDLMDDNGFVTSMFNIRVQDLKGEINTTYYDYLHNHQKKAWFTYPIDWVKNLFKKDITENSNKAFDPYHLSIEDQGIADMISGNVKISTDKKTGIITIKSQAQDALICKTLADSIKSRLQAFITKYRTNKARIDYEYYKKLAINAKKDYEKARQLYGSYSDANSDLILTSYRAKIDDLENDMQLKYNTYSTIIKQLEAAKAKVQEQTPAFTVIKGAEVPIKPSGPKRVILTLICLFVSFAITCVYILAKKPKTT